MEAIGEIFWGIFSIAFSLQNECSSIELLGSFWFFWEMLLLPWCWRNSLDPYLHGPDTVPSKRSYPQLFFIRSGLKQWVQFYTWWLINICSRNELVCANSYKLQSVARGHFSFVFLFSSFNSKTSASCAFLEVIKALEGCKSNGPTV